MSYNNIMQAIIPPIQTCKRCHFRTPEPPLHCPVCFHSEFEPASPPEQSALAQKALVLHATQAVRLAVLARRFPQEDALREAAEEQRWIAESLAYSLGAPHEELGSLLQDSIFAQFSQLPGLAQQAEEQAAEALATQLKWLASRQAEIVKILAQLQEVDQTSQ